MGLMSWLREKATPALTLPNGADSLDYERPLVPYTETAGGITVHLGHSEIMGMTAAQLYRTQPHLRTVVDFLARNIAQLGIKAYRRQEDNDRVTASDGPAAGIIAKPNATMTRYELIRSLVSDLALWDRAYWLVVEDADAASGWNVRPIPAPWVVGTRGGDLFAPSVYQVMPPNGKQIEIAASAILHFHGWAPDSAVRGVSPVDTLREILAEQIHSVRNRDERWRHAGRVGAVLTRPAGVPSWSKEARERFMEEWKAKYAGPDATHAGGTPILEDGMTLTPFGSTSKDDEFVAASKLSLSTVASVYHVNPTMVGILDNANYSNVREFRRMLYGDTLGPIISMIEDRLNTFLLPLVGEDPDVYVEFNIAEKLQGSFEEQADVASRAVGGPYMTRNEMRARFNLPRLDDADELIVPMNVTEGGQASPADSAPPPKKLVIQRRSATPSVKAEPDELHEQDCVDVLISFFERQRKAVLSQLGAKAAPEWWNEERWNAELGAELEKLADKTVVEIGAATLAALGLPDEFDSARVAKFLRKLAETRAEMINGVTLRQLEEAVAGNESGAAAAVFDTATKVRAPEAGRTLATTLAAFAAVEAVKQKAPETGRKTWRTHSKHPRKAHAEMNGESVPIGELFSNGAKWPGDWVLGIDGVAGCLCTVEVSGE